MKKTYCILLSIIIIVCIGYGLLFGSINSCCKNLIEAKLVVTPQQKPSSDELNIGTIDIQPYGNFPDNLINEADSGILKMYKLKVVVLKALPLPDAAFYPPRNRYRAEKLLTDLENHLSKGSSKIIGLTIKDISTTKNGYEDWGIFGLGSLSGSTCVVSTFRLRAHNASDELLKERLIKVINHEIGHTLGLLHCPNANCLMEDGKGSINTVDNEDGTFCSDCAKKVKAYLRNPN